MKRRQFLLTAPLLTSAAFAGPAKVTRWDVITIGNLSRNRYWGESDAIAEDWQGQQQQMHSVML